MNHTIMLSPSIGLFNSTTGVPLNKNGAIENDASAKLKNQLIKTLQQLTDVQYGVMSLTLMMGKIIKDYDYERITKVEAINNIKDKLWLYINE